MYQCVECGKEYQNCAANVLCPECTAKEAVAQPTPPNGARSEICPSCVGTGRWSGGGVGGEHICGACRGTGNLPHIA